MTTKREAYTPRDVFQGLVKVAGDDVLIGGQALAVWVELYRIKLPEQILAISRDVDFLTTSPTAQASLQRYAKVLDGKTHIYEKERITALVGQAYKELPNEEVLNVDVLWTVVGIDPATVRDNAVMVTQDGVSFLVMHPMDVLRSRLFNLHKLPEKQDEGSVLQLRLAVGVMRAHLREQSAQFTDEDLSTGRSPLQSIVSAIEKLSIDDAGRKIAKRYGVHVADAVDPSLIPSGPFWEKKWPVLKELMSPEYGRQFAPPVELGITTLAQQWNAVPGKLQVTGRVVAVSESEVIQDAGHGKHIVWDRRQLQDGNLAVGERVTIHHSGRIDRSRRSKGLGR